MPDRRRGSTSIGSTAPVGAYALGGGRWQQYDPGEAPLEPLVEATGDRPDVRLRVEAGAHFVRLLGSRNLERYRERFVAACRFTGRDHLAGDVLLAALASTVPDATDLARSWQRSSRDGPAG